MSPDFKNEMKSKFVYVTFIKTTPQKLWDALTKPEFQKIYFFGTIQESTFKKGAPWRMVGADSGKTFDSGEILESDPPNKLVIKWRNEWMPEMNAEGYGRCTIEVAQAIGSVKLTITHEHERENSKLIAGVSGGWPQIISSLKSYLETGEAMERPIEKSIK
jgi:uncharacterized protein YndB with AHSA1/START domain